MSKTVQPVGLVLPLIALYIFLFTAGIVVGRGALLSVRANPPAIVVTHDGETHVHAAGCDVQLGRLLCGRPAHVYEHGEWFSLEVFDGRS